MLVVPHNMLSIKQCVCVFVLAKNLTAKDFSNKTRIKITAVTELEELTVRQNLSTLSLSLHTLSI